MGKSKPNKIALITPFSPAIGGGSVILRSLIPHLKGIELTWFYFHDRETPIVEPIQCVRIGDPLAKPGSIFQGMWDTWRIWLFNKSARFQKALEYLESREFDQYWLVAHGDNVPFINYLRKHSKRPIHLSIEDDLISNHFARSKRYVGLGAVGRTRFHEAMKEADSIDFISQAMKKYYGQTLGLKGTVTHRYLKSLPNLPAFKTKANQFTVGQIGSVYSFHEIDAFLGALRQFSKEKKVEGKFIAIGMAGRTRVVYDRYPEIVEVVEDLDESEAVKLLSQCDLLYTSYPFAPQYEVFRRTSAQVKMTTYVCCQRPVFAHTPPDSTLADWVGRYGIGVICDTIDTSKIVSFLNEVSESKPPSLEKFEKIREEVWGWDNVSRLEEVLLGSSAKTLKLSA